MRECGLGIRLSPVEPVSTATEFSAGVDATVDGLALPVGRSRHSILGDPNDAARDER